MKLAAGIILCFCVLVFFQGTLTSITGIEFFNYFDELLEGCAFFALFFFSFLKAKIKTNFLLIIGLLFYLVLVSLIFGFQEDNGKVFIQCIIHLKLFVFLVFFSFFNVKQLLRFSKYVIYIVLFGLFLELIFREHFYDFIDLPYHLRPENRRAKLIYGGFIHSNNVSLLVMFWYFVWLVGEFKKKRTLKIALVTFFVFTSLFLYGSRTSILAILGILFYLYRTEMIIKPKILLIGLVGFILLSINVYLFTDIVERSITNIQDSFSRESQYIRGLMIYLSVIISVTYFPIGTGAATYGTVTSESSPIYSLLGVSERGPFINMQGVYDSNFASILGEFGVIGIILFYFILKYLLRIKGTSLLRKNLSKGLFLALFISSLTMPIFMNSNTALIIAIGVIVLKEITYQRHFKTEMC